MFGIVVRYPIAMTVGMIAAASFDAALAAEPVLTLCDTAVLVALAVTSPVCTLLNGVGLVLLVCGHFCTSLVISVFVRWDHHLSDLSEGESHMKLSSFTCSGDEIAEVGSTLGV